MIWFSSLILFAGPNSLGDGYVEDFEFVRFLRWWSLYAVEFRSEQKGNLKINFKLAVQHCRSRQAETRRLKETNSV